MANTVPTVPANLDQNEYPGLIDHVKGLYGRICRYIKDDYQVLVKVQKVGASVQIVEKSFG